MCDSVSRCLQLGSIKLFQPEDYVMAVVWASSTWKDLRGVTDIFAGILHKSDRCDEHRGTSRYESYVTD